MDWRRYCVTQGDRLKAIERWTQLPRPHAEFDQAAVSVGPHADKAPPPLNRQEALPYFGGDEQLFRDLLNQFVSYLDLDEEIARLRALKDFGDAAAFARVRLRSKG